MFWSRPDAPTRRFLARLHDDLKQAPATPSVAERRAALVAMAAAYGPALMPVARVEDAHVPGPVEVPVRLYFPETKSRDPAPLVVHFHGGGWTLGDAQSYERVCRAYSAAGRCIVADVAYRRSPENKFPAARDDCAAALTWLAGKAEALGADPARIVVTGDSAGGCLAAVVCRTTEVRVARQILVYPMTTVSRAADYPSRRMFGDGDFFLTRFDIDRARDEYCADPAQAESEEVSPLLAKDLSGAPPALIVTAGLDPLRDEGADYARRLKAAGVAVDYVCVPRTVHGFVLFAGAIPRGRHTIRRIGHAIRTVRPRR